MAHNLNFNEQTGEYSFFSVNEKPWHGLGKIVSDYPNSREAIQFAGLDYTVEKRPLFTFDIENQNANPDSDIIIPEIEVPGYCATVRTDSDTVLGVVGKDYEIIQNRDAFTFFDSIVGGDGIQYETAGALGKGERIFITAKLPGYIKVGNGDLIEKYLFLTTSHDGYGSITAAFTPTRIVCNNTLNAALRNCSNRVKIRHTAGAKERLETAHKIMGISNKLTEEMEQIFNQWSKVRVSDPELKKLIHLAMVPNREILQDIQNGKENKLSTCFKNICDNVFSYAMSAPSQQLETTKGTLFGVYNAVTGYFQNVRSYKTGEAKLKSIIEGNAMTKNQKAFNLCSDFMSSELVGIYQ